MFCDIFPSRGKLHTNVRGELGEVEQIRSPPALYFNAQQIYKEAKGDEPASRR
jgi:hypothetical protein